MSKPTDRPPTPLRLSDEILGRADKLVKRLADRPEFTLAPLTRSGVLRLAILRGLDVLEGEAKRSRR